MTPMTCAFCGKSQDRVRKLIAGPGRICICDECVAACDDLVREDEPEPREPLPLPRPRDIHAFLDQYVIGQEHAKVTLAVAVYNHYKRIRAGEEPVELGKSNILLLGPTGSGKTYLAQTLARMLDVPFAIADATTLTEAGYVGEDVEHILFKLLQAAGFDARRAETGIVYLDEVDKIGRRSENPSIVRDVSGEGVQQALLKIIEGAVVNVPRQGSQRETVAIDTTNVLFVAGGAFDGLEEIIGRRTRRRGAGFGAPQPARGGGLAEVMPADLLAFGLIPELVGRLPVLAALEPLDRTTLERILLEPRNALIKQYRKLFELDGIELEFTEDAVAAIAEQALLRHTGARATRAVLEEVLLDVMFEVPGRGDVARVLISRDTVLGTVNPTLVPRGEPERREKSA
ncbi:ATP-dependent Clp protease ATP-binding subunit ClpX [Nonomuraea sp. SBT364]|uniref:ATP-dependent Clp protease ATP-binding subunit ClpX n=1 Tax=Nonomuraea sp. SBT364 TaxID=1580530 RepID=UPI00066A3113|nr:ATP-dependent Clp protease ATP-binding subunit ClpX [Nonomuraea sp. SBT364]